MDVSWLKQPMPRSLYGRAALILIVPIVTIQLVVSIVFIQRHFEDVTQQMTRNLMFELRYLLGQVDLAEDVAAAQSEIDRLIVPLALRVTLRGQGPTQDTRLFYDLSGRVVIATLRDGIDDVQGIDLRTNDKEVRLVVNTRYGPLALSFDRRRVSASNPHQLLVLMIFTGLLMTLIAVLFLRNQLRPIRRLARAATAFGKGRSVDYRPSGAVEVRVAGNAFLDMRARIERQIEQRTLMLSGVSHDLRTPLTRLKLGLSMLEDDEAKDLLRDVDDMQRLLDAFLDFSRGDALEEPERLDPYTLARDVVERAARTGEDVSLLGEAPPASVEVSLRPLSVERALENLIGNAVRYGTRCEVSVEVLERAVRFRVEDDGPGIPADVREEAFKAFSRLEPARNQNKGTGVGLGLAITTDIARAHGGTLRLGQSAALGGLRADLVLAR